MPDDQFAAQQSKGGQNLGDPGPRPKPPMGSGLSEADAARLALWPELVEVTGLMLEGYCHCRGTGIITLLDEQYGCGERLCAQVRALLAKARELQ